jgi:hypothetical protein
MAAANAQNMGQPEMASKLMTMMVWSICTADSGGPDIRYPTAQACAQAGLLGSMPVAMSEAPAPPEPQRAREPQVAMNGKVTPEAAYRAASHDDSAKVAGTVPR